MHSYSVRAYNGRHQLEQSQLRAILERDLYICVYCSDIANVVDHVVPWNWSQCDDPDNLVASCLECNLIASDKMFADLGEKTFYIRTIREGKKWRKKIHQKHHACGWCGNIYRLQYGDYATNIICPACGKQEYG